MTADAWGAHCARVLRPHSYTSLQPEGVTTLRLRLRLYSERRAVPPVLCSPEGRGASSWVMTKYTHSFSCAAGALARSAAPQAHAGGVRGGPGGAAPPLVHAGSTMRASAPPQASRAAGCRETTSERLLLLVLLRAPQAVAAARSGATRSPGSADRCARGHGASPAARSPFEWSRAAGWLRAAAGRRTRAGAAARAAAPGAAWPSLLLRPRRRPSMAPPTATGG